MLDWGKDIFKSRLTSGSYSDWASLKTIRPLVSFVQKSGLASLVADILNLFGMQTPIVLTIKKKKSYAGILKGKIEVSPDFDEPDWELIKQIEESVKREE